MVSIYLIEDINDLKYVGSTTKKLNDRLTGHRYDKKTRNTYCSSSKLNLYNCIIIELERCNKEDKKERERYWINKIDCVNQIKLNFDRNEYQKEYDKKNKEQIKEYQKLDWFCSDCKCNIKLTNKSRHLKTQKHQINTNNYLSDKNP